MIRSSVLSIAVLGLAACTSMPEVDADLGVDPPGTDYPALLPIADLQAIDAGIPDTAEDDAEALEARADALRARAAALSGQ